MIDIKIIIWSILLGILVALLIFFILTRTSQEARTRRKRKLPLLFSFIAVISLCALGIGFYFLNPTQLNQRGVEFPMTGTLPTSPALIESAKSLYGTPADGLITFSLFTPIVFLAFATVRNVSREKAVSKSKTEFVSIASHQLRSPTTAIGWYADMLLSEDVGPLNEEQKEYLREIQFGNQRMIDLVNSLLSVSRIELDTFKIQLGPVDIARIADDVLEELLPQIIESDLKVERDFEKDLARIESDQKLVRIIFQNILSNAVSYTPPNGKISVRIGKKDKGVHIEIEDNGYGIPKDARSKIYTKFFRADNVRAVKPDGTGLGLYITKSAVKTLGGTIGFKSEEKKGTVFWVDIPGRDLVKRKL